MSSMSAYLEKALLEHATGRASFTMPTPFLALLTVVPTAASTGTTITEATYTGYARLSLSGTAGWNATSGSAPAVIKNKALAQFAACTGGSSKIKAVALLDVVTVKTGNMLVWTEVAEFEVSTTATPAEAAAEAIEFSLT